MNMSDMENKFHMRRYSITEIDALRRAIFNHCYTGFYLPSQDETSRVFSDHPSPAKVEEQLRTTMFAGLTVDDMFDIRPKGYAVQRSGTTTAWWNQGKQEWTATLEPGGVMANRDTATSQMLQDKYRDRTGANAIPQDSARNFYNRGVAVCAGEIYTLFHATSDRSGAAAHGPAGIDVGDED